MSLADVVHVLIDVAAGRRNISQAEADDLHNTAHSEPEQPQQAPQPEPVSDEATEPAEAPEPAQPAEGNPYA